MSSKRDAARILTGFLMMEGEDPSNNRPKKDSPVNDEEGYPINLSGLPDYFTPPDFVLELEETEEEL